jgi:Holliday junction DNA helicase RuvA
MIAYIKGIIIHASPTHVVLETGGIGYKVFIPVSALGKLPQIGETAALHTSFVIRELSQTLYGFLANDERDFFEALMGVTGVGPKLALAMIGHMSLNELQTAIRHSDIPAICRIPGIGKKGAERLVVEMRDKVHVTAVDPDDFSIHLQRDAKTDFMSQRISDAMSALINLGYNQITAQKAIKKSLKDASEDIDLATLITTSLSHV